MVSSPWEVCLAFHVNSSMKERMIHVTYLSLDLRAPSAELLDTFGTAGHDGPSPGHPFYPSVVLGKNFSPASSCRCGNWWCPHSPWTSPCWKSWSWQELQNAADRGQVLVGHAKIKGLCSQSPGRNYRLGRGRKVLKASNKYLNTDVNSH